MSVIIPTYNTAPFIVETLESVLAQTFTSYEILVVNDGSPDTEALERTLAPYRDRIVYITQRNRGPAGARNTGIRAASGRYIALLDSDDAWCPGFLAAQVGFLEAHPDFDLVSCDGILFDNPKYSGKHFSDLSPSGGEVTLERLLALRCSVLASSVVVRKDLLLTAGLFDETQTHAEDYECWLRLAKGGARLAYQHTALIRHRYRPDSLSTNILSLHRGALSALLKLEGAGGLSTAELRALEGTRRRLSAAVHLELGKQDLAGGHHARAREHFVAAQRHRRTWKIALALAGLRLCPRLVTAIYAQRHRQRRQGPHPQ